MRDLIIAFAQTLFPEQDILKSLEMLDWAVSATIDDICFAMEDAEEYPAEPEHAEPEYEYLGGIWYPI
jgi:hypothetical protein